jgi:hypothetical protein
MARKSLVVKQKKLDDLRIKYNDILKGKKDLSWEERYKLYKKYK